MSSQNKAPEPASATTPPTFEAALTRLEEIVARLERGEITLDESLAAFQEGSGLVRLCMDRINAAEVEVQKLVRGESGGANPENPDEGASSREDL